MVQTEIGVPWEFSAWHVPLFDHIHTWVQLIHWAGKIIAAVPFYSKNRILLKYARMICDNFSFKNVLNLHRWSQHKQTLLLMRLWCSEVPVSSSLSGCGCIPSSLSLGPSILPSEELFQLVQGWQKALSSSSLMFKLCIVMSVISLTSACATQCSSATRKHCDNVIYH